MWRFALNCILGAYGAMAGKLAKPGLESNKVHEFAQTQLCVYVCVYVYVLPNEKPKKYWQKASQKSSARISIEQELPSFGRMSKLPAKLGLGATDSSLSSQLQSCSQWSYNNTLQIQIQIQVLVFLFISLVFLFFYQQPEPILMIIFQNFLFIIISCCCCCSC